MRNNWYKKSLVVGIIVLFIGVGVQPAFADTSIITISNNEDDCGCQVVSKSDVYRIERLLNRVEIYTKIISLLSKHNPEIKEKCEELSNKITKFKEMNEEMKNDSPFQYNPIICAIIEIIFLPRIIAFEYFLEILSNFYDLFPLLYEFLLLCYELSFDRYIHLLIKYDCIDWP